MNEHDGNMMLAKRMQTLEELALDYLRALCARNGAIKTPEQLRRMLESTIDDRAPGCGHFL
jgi:hypothetical protein